MKRYFLFFMISLIIPITLFSQEKITVSASAILYSVLK